MQNKGVLLIICFVLLVSFVSATFSYYESFETKTSNQQFPPAAEGAGSCSTYLYEGNGFPTDACNSIVRSDGYASIPARYGSQFLDNKCDWVDCTSAGMLASQRTHIIYGRPSGWSPCNGFKIDDGTEYWIAWSNYIPENYYQELFGHMIMEFIASNTVIFDIYYGGGYSGGNYDAYNYYRAQTYYDGAKHGPSSIGGLWQDDQGTWVDWVLHIRWYDTPNANAIMEIYRDGVLSYSRSGGTNLPADSSGNPPVLVFTEYNTFNYYDIYPDCKYNGNWVLRAGEFGDAPTPWRRVPLDEIRITEDTAGAKGYCDAVAPIWSAKPAITYPSNGATDVPSSFTAVYSGYSDYREDPQHCFSYAKTQIQIDESGGDWSTPVYDSGEINAQTGKEISGLFSQQYQMRARHKSIRSGTLDTYWGDWSGTSFFTVGKTIPACSQGQITSRCLCGGKSYLTGYCCSGTWQISSCSAPPQNLVAHYDFDESTGTAANDVSGNGNTGALTNGPAWTAGKINGALNFDGVDDYVSVPDSVSLNPDYLTTSLWFKADGFADDTGLIAKGSDSNRQFWEWIYHGNLSLEIGNAGFTNYIYPFQKDTWYNLAVTYDGSNIITYINGAQVSVIPQSTGAIPSDTNPLYMGALPGYVSFDGTIDDVRIYNYALSASEILTIYNEGAGSACNSIADSDGDSSISIGELINFISQWKAGNVTIGNLIDAIGKWKNGC